MDETPIKDTKSFTRNLEKAIKKNKKPVDRGFTFYSNKYTGCLLFFFIEIDEDFFSFFEGIDTGVCFEFHLICAAGM